MLHFEKTTKNYLQGSKYFRNILSFILVNFPILFLYHNPVKANLGCNYENINIITEKISEKISNEYLNIICEGVIPSQKKLDNHINYSESLEIDKNNNLLDFLGFKGTDTFEIEIGPLGLFRRNEKSFELYYKYLNSSNLCYSFGLANINFKSIPSINKLFVSAGYDLDLFKLLKITPQVRYSPNIGLYLATPIYYEFELFTFGVSLKFIESFSISFLTGYDF